MGAPRNLLSEWCRLLVESLAEAGVTDVVLSPGSRSTPLVLAIDAAERRGALRCHDVIDERAAGFHALGMARATGRAPLLVCTSGTAGAHYLPAIIEAGMSHTPLLVLTADRPLELTHCAAPQTIDQIKLFGDHARAFFELGIPDDSDGALRALRRVAAQAVEASTWPAPGAVHLNARARKPLEPPTEESMGEPESALSARVSALLSRRLVRTFPPRLSPDARAIDELATACLAARRGVILCGPAPMSQAGARTAVLALARATGFPLLAEAASQLRFATGRDGVTACDRFDALLGLPRLRADLAPDLIVQIGAPPTSSAVDAWLEAHAACPRWVLGPHGWNDPSSRAAALLRGEVGATARVLADRIEAARPGPAEGEDWRTRFAAAEVVAGGAIEAFLDERRAGEAAAVRAIVQALGAAQGRARPPVLALGNSLPIRTVDLVCDGAVAPQCAVLSQRGANGIDGLIAGAAGVARGGWPTLLLLGDVSALHDVGGLQAAQGLEAPLAVVILDNGGGRIFDTLPVASRPDLALAMRHFHTPHGARFEHAAALFGHRFATPATIDDLRGAVEEGLGTPGCTVIAVSLPHDPSGELRALRARVEAALEGQPDLLQGKAR